MNEKSHHILAVIIPTANRRHLLNETLKQISLQTLNPNLIIVIEHLDDSEYQSIDIEIPKNLEKAFVYLKAELPSAATQRNQGLDFLESTFADSRGIIFFHDDDLLIPDNYFEVLSNHLEQHNNLVGVSGIALPGQKTNHGFIGLLKRLLSLDSKTGGRVLKNTVNVPFKVDSVYENRIQKSEWLIGCSAWLIPQVLSERFEKQFRGQSIAEDVIFSMKMSKRGSIAVDTKLLFTHLESPIGRDTQAKFLMHWIQNHFEMIILFPERKMSRLLLFCTSIVLINKYFVSTPFRVKRRVFKDYLLLNSRAIRLLLKAI